MTYEWLDLMLTTLPLFLNYVLYLQNNDTDFLDLFENTKHCNNKPRVTATTD